MGDLAVELAVTAIVRNGSDGRGHSQNGDLDGRHFELRLLMLGIGRGRCDANAAAGALE
jgi:hypothetical protein